MSSSLLQFKPTSLSTMPSPEANFRNRIPPDGQMDGRSSVVNVALSLLLRQQQQQQQQQEQEEIANVTTTAEASADSPSLQQQELLALTAGEIADLCLLQRSTEKNTLPYDALDPFAMDATLRLPEIDPRSIDQRLMALRDALQSVSRSTCGSQVHVGQNNS
jgi:Arc/MetJ-type ribon-helix-helix transcriptional regulator